MSVRQVLFVFVVQAGISRAVFREHVTQAARQHFLACLMRWTIRVMWSESESGACRSFLPRLLIVGPGRVIAPPRLAPASMRQQHQQPAVATNTIIQLVMMVQLYLPSIIHEAMMASWANTTTLRRLADRLRKADNGLRSTDW